MFSIGSTAPTTSPDVPDSTAVPSPVPSLGALLRDGSAAVMVAALAVVAVVLVGQAGGVSTVVSGAAIPASGFAALTVLFSVVGLGLAIVLRQFARRPRTAWVRAAVTLTVLSFLPDVLADATASTALFLMLTHVVAAAIVIPTVARRLA